MRWISWLFLVCLAVVARAVADAAGDSGDPFEGEEEEAFAAGDFMGLSSREPPPAPAEQVSLSEFFTGALGGAQLQPITKSLDFTRPFTVGGDTFPDFASAGRRACDNQKNSCAALANEKNINVTVAKCDKQRTQCYKNIKTATVTSFFSKVSQNSQFQFFCDN